MKIVAMYLPQFHRTPENDEWWGEGFTDWEAVKSAVPLFDGHRQPRIPLNKNYYDLLEKDTMIWQANLMRQFGIDGVCMYHYWFKDNRQVLEKPAENLLEWRDIDMPYCFCWANETWARSWSNIRIKNPWADNFETEGGSEILLAQQYGTVRQWTEHFLYLLPFFKDERYICVDGKPVFVIYIPWKIPCLLPMVDCWRKLAGENGLGGLHLIGVLERRPHERGLDAGLSHEPIRAKDNIDRALGYEKGVYGYDEVWDNIQAYVASESNYYGAFVDYDDSPRRGGKGYRVEGFSIGAFRENLRCVMQKNLLAGNELLFINAWNEWGEGMYMEPDEVFGTQVLEAIKSVKKTALTKGRAASRAVLQQEDGSAESAFNVDRYKAWFYVDLLDQWMKLKERNISMGMWLEKHCIKNVALYGYGIFGRHMLKELSTSGINVSFVVDQKGAGLDCPVDVFSPDEDFPAIDAIVVTVPYDYDEIYKCLKGRVEAPIVPMQQMIEECMYGM